MQFLLRGRLVAGEHQLRDASRVEPFEQVPPSWHVRQTAADGRGVIADECRKTTERRGDQPLDLLAQQAREHRSGTARGDGDRHRVAIDDRRQDEAAQGRAIDDVDGNATCLRCG